MNNATARLICGIVPRSKKIGKEIPMETKKHYDQDPTNLFAELEPTKTIDMTFDEYNRLHPEIWHEFKKLALALVVKGRKHYGARCLVEVIRYHRDLKYADRDFKINNNFVADYARKFNRVCPEHGKFFEMRRRKGEK
jgi:hypothetical protein